MTHNKMPRIYSFAHYRFWTSFWIHMRPYLLFVSGIAGMAGMSFYSDVNFTHWKFWVALLSFFFAYGFGQALTDCSQIDTDRISAPYRPLSRGIVTARQVAIAAILGLLMVSIVIVYLNLLNLIFCALSIVGLATYSHIKRNYWWAGPFYNAWIVALLPVMGYLAVSSTGLHELMDQDMTYLVLLTFFSYSYFVLIGYLKDISADQQTGYQTFPVVFGWNASVWVGDILMVVSAIWCWMIITPKSASLFIWILAIIIAIVGQGYAHMVKDQNEKNAVLPIQASLRSFILWHLAVVIAHYPSVLVFAGIYYFTFEMVLRRRPLREQI